MGGEEGRGLIRKKKVEASAPREDYELISFKPAVGNFFFFKLFGIFALTVLT